jgi:hypothetical protein
MAQKRLDNARFTLPLILGVLIIGLLARYGVFSALLRNLATLATIAAIPALVAYMFIDQSGWRDLARKYPATLPIMGTWRTCRTAILSGFSPDDPNYERHKVRLSFIVRVKADDEALYVSSVPVFTLLFPPLRLPWSAIARVRYFDPSGWYKYSSGAGLVFQLNYDPGYKEQFVEIQIADPLTFLQLPVALLTEAAAHFPA